MLSTSTWRAIPAERVARTTVPDSSSLRLAQLMRSNVTSRCASEAPPVTNQMIEFLANILSQKGFMPHGMCFQWQPEILWMHVIADLVVAIAYFSIPVALIIVLYRRRHIPFRWLILLFALFILLCGMTHVVGIIVLWEPIYRLQGLIKLATAAVSIATAVVLFPLLPKLMVAAEKFEQTLEE